MSSAPSAWVILILANGAPPQQIAIDSRPDPHYGVVDVVAANGDLRLQDTHFTPEATAFMLAEDLGNTWTQTATLLHEHFVDVAAIEVSLHIDHDLPGTHSLYVAVTTPLDVDRATDAYRSFLRAWTRVIPLARHEQLSFALTLP